MLAESKLHERSYGVSGPAILIEKSEDVYPTSKIIVSLNVIDINDPSML